MIKFSELKLKFDVKNILIFFALAILILWKMLLPGYVLALDMIFTPDMSVAFNADKFLNFLPISFLIYWLSLLMPVCIIQKILLLAIFFAIGYGAFKFLPVGPSRTVRWFSALFFLFNPFVYTRMLVGQWLVLAGYALLPLLLYNLLVFQKKKDFSSILKLFGTLFIMSVLSNHFFLMSVILTVIWFLISTLREIGRKNFEKVFLVWKNILAIGIMFLVVSSYWLIPALQRNAPLEQRLGTTHWEYFSAGGYKNIDPLLNLVSLNGFWGERNAWAKSFLWPQDYITFWIAFALIGLLIIIGIATGLHSRENRNKTIIFSAIGFCALVFSAGIGDTIFRNLNLWFFENVPLWTGFRDSQKFSGFLVLSYAVLSGLGLSFVLDFMERVKFSYGRLVVPLLFLIPFFFGFLMWGGFHGQLKPIWYPQAWFEAREIMDNDKSSAQTLFLPWHGYMSFKFNNNIVSANPARRFFGEKAVVSRSVEVGGVYDQESDPSYRELDQIISDNVDSGDAIDFLKKRNIKRIVWFQDLQEADNLQYDFLQSDRLGVTLESADLIMYEIK